MERTEQQRSTNGIGLTGLTSMAEIGLLAQITFKTDTRLSRVWRDTRLLYDLLDTGVNNFAYILFASHISISFIDVNSRFSFFLYPKYVL